MNDEPKELNCGPIPVSSDIYANHTRGELKTLASERDAARTENAALRTALEAAYPFIVDAGIHGESDEGMGRQYCGYCGAQSEWFSAADGKPETDLNGNLPMAHTEICIAENARKLFNALYVDVAKVQEGDGK